jgi:hypothetical protein
MLLGGVLFAALMGKEARWYEYSLCQMGLYDNTGFEEYILCCYSILIYTVS